jgi:hypothetical protein
MIIEASAKAAAAPPIFFHKAHRGFGLDIQSARIETNTFADQRHLWFRHIPKAEIDETRRLGGSAADGMNERQSHDSVASAASCGRLAKR